MLPQVERKEGQVVSFSAYDGYGFLRPDGSEDNVFVHATSIRPSNAQDFRNGARVEYSRRNSRAFDVQPTRQEMISGEVRSFDDRRRFGFIDVVGVDVPIFVHSSAIRRWGRPTLGQGDKVQFFVVETPRGLQAIDVRMQDRNAAHGGIQWFDPAGLGKGLIIPDQGGPNLHFDNSGITRIGERRLMPDERVAFSIRRSRKGLEAVDVAVLSDRAPRSNAGESLAEVSVRTLVEVADVSAKRDIRLAEIDKEKEIELANIELKKKQSEYERDIEVSKHEKTMGVVESVAGVLVAIVNGIAFVIDNG